MAFKVGFQGVEITCETPEELRITLTTLLGLVTQGAGKPVRTERMVESGNGASRWTVDRFARFLDAMRKKRPRKLLELLINNPDGMTDETLRRELGLRSNNALAGVTTGIVKTAKKLGVGRADVFVKTRVNVGDQVMFEYHLAPAFVEVARQYGWPKKSQPNPADFFEMATTKSE